MTCPTCGDPLDGAEERCPNCGVTATDAGGGGATDATDDADASVGTAGATDDARPDRSVFGLPRPLASGFSYSLTFVSGLAMYLLVDDDRVRFHAARSLVVFGGLFGLSLVLSVLRGAVAGLVGESAAAILGIASTGTILLAFGLWLVLLLAAFRERRIVLPYVDDVVDGLASGRE